MGRGIQGVSEKFAKSESFQPTQENSTTLVTESGQQTSRLAVNDHHRHYSKHHKRPEDHGAPTTAQTDLNSTSGAGEHVNKDTASAASINNPKPSKKSSDKDEKEAAEPEKGLSGNFQHFPKKTRRFDYEDVRRGKDNFFHVDVATECETYFKAQRVRLMEKKTEHFAFIVDLDAYEYHKVVFHLFLNEILESSFFRLSILVLVLVNAIIIGLQTDPNMVSNYATYFYIFDQVILSVFLFEILIKWIYDFRLFWKVGWNIMDFIIIFLIILAAVIPTFRNSRALVVVRVVRAFLSSLKIVMHTIIRSGVDMGNILIVLMIFMLVMSIMGVILFDYPELETKHFLTAVDAWFVLFICVTQDGWNQVLDEFRSNTTYFPWLAVYLILAVSIGAFVFANLIVAVIVANLELSVKEMREEAKASNNPLEFHPEISNNVVEMLPVYDLLSKHNSHILSQRPLRIPNLKKLTQRRIQTYISLIVALEQNMLEAQIINLDLEKILGVILSVVLQLDMYSQQQAHENELKRTYNVALAKSKQIDGATNIIPPPTPSQVRQMTAKNIKMVTTLPDLANKNANIEESEVPVCDRVDKQRYKHASAATDSGHQLEKKREKAYLWAKKVDDNNDDDVK
ncbi:Cation channel sperm-associated protein 4 [Folsomia candida]|uniref:Cation channel sperm-associated protein 4 n=1 Tax=Folsomia candida TaxID=158441 RepID=A0A226E2I2_FOLCA|nr:Cation channel sperm-associated protein 4 [Folsomia candida]